jgi:propionyl-CoA carboxylase alpha chain
MNTRLQVEHPVTEAVTGIDLVEQMIRVAAGERLAFGQDDIRLNGWAIENRIYAEDPYRGFLPSTGRLVRYSPPKATGTPYASPGERVPTSLDTNGVGDAGTQNPFASSEVEKQSGYVRIDDGVAEGGEVSMFYDPMIAKLITWAPTRDEAADLQVQALDGFQIEGLGQNIDFLSALMQHPRFRSGALTTGFIAEEYPDGFAGAPASGELTRALAAVAAGLSFTTAGRARQISGQLGTAPLPSSDWTVRIGGSDHQVTLADGHAMVDGERVAGTMHWQPGDRMATATANGDTLLVKVKRTRTGWLLTTRGAAHKAEVLPAHIAPYARHMIEKVPPDMSRFLLCPMPGLLTQLHVAPGDKVEAGQPLAVIEAMKMENILRTEKSAVVKAANFAPGDSLAVDAAILEFE